LLYVIVPPEVFCEAKNALNKGAYDAPSNPIVGRRGDTFFVSHPARHLRRLVLSAYDA